MIFDNARISPRPYLHSAEYGLVHPMGSNNSRRIAQGTIAPNATSLIARKSAKFQTIAEGPCSDWRIQKGRRRLPCVDNALLGEI